MPKIRNRIGRYVIFLFTCVGLAYGGDAPPANEAHVPLLMGYQGYLTNGGDQPFDSGPAEFEFRITDAQQQPLFTESQVIDVVAGVVSTVIGNGIDPASQASHAGVPPDLFSTSDPRFLEVWHNGLRVDDPTMIVSVPYALVSAEAQHVVAGGVDAAALAPGSIALSNFSPELLDQLAVELPTRAGFQAAAGLSAHTPFSYSTATDIEAVLHDLDRAIKAREEKNVSRDGDSLFGALLFRNGGATTATIDAATGNITTPGTIDGIDVGDHAAATVAHGSAGKIVGVDEPVGGELSGTIKSLAVKPGAITGTKIADGTIAPNHLAQNTYTTIVTVTKDTQPLSGDLSGTPGNAQLNAGSVGSAEIADGSIAPIDLNPATYTAIINTTKDTQPLSGDLSGTPGNAQLNAGSVGSTEILDGSIGTVELADNAVTSGKVADGSIALVDIDPAAQTAIIDAAAAKAGADAKAAADAAANAALPVPKIVAWGKTSCSSVGCDTPLSYNIKKVLRPGLARMTIEFTEPLSSTDYAVMTNVEGVVEAVDIGLIDAVKSTDAVTVGRSSPDFTTMTFFVVMNK